MFSSIRKASLWTSAARDANVGVAVGSSATSEGPDGGGGDSPVRAVGSLSLLAPETGGGGSGCVIEVGYFSDELHKAAAAGDLSRLRIAVQKHKGDAIDRGDKDGCTALHVAASHGHTHVIGELLDRQAKTLVADKYGRIPLHVAVAAGKTAAVSVLLGNRGCQTAGPGRPSGLRITPGMSSGLASAALPLHQQMVDLQTAAVERAAAQLAARDKLGRDALMHAVLCGHTVIVEQLLKAGADPRTRCTAPATQDDVTALHAAAELGHLSTMAAIAAALRRCAATPLNNTAFASFDGGFGSSQPSPRGSGAGSTSPQGPEVSVGSPSMPNVPIHPSTYLDQRQMGTGRTALHCAVVAGQTAAAAWLVRAGSSQTAKDNWSQTAMELAISTGNSEMVRALREASAVVAAELGQQQQQQRRAATPEQQHYPQQASAGGMAGGVDGERGVVTGIPLQSRGGFGACTPHFPGGVSMTTTLPGGLAPTDATSLQLLQQTQQIHQLQQQIHIQNLHMQAQAKAGQGTGILAAPPPGFHTNTISTAPLPELGGGLPRQPPIGFFSSPVSRSVYPPLPPGASEYI